MTTAATLADNASLMTTPSGTAPSFLCRAWVNFDGTGTPAIRASGNVSSITDNGTGDYTVNFTTAMPDANYAGMGAVSDDGNYLSGRSAASRLAGSFRVATKSDGGSFGDLTGVYVAIFR
jgi:hypothetical protein